MRSAASRRLAPLRSLSPVFGGPVANACGMPEIAEIKTIQLQGGENCGPTHAIMAAVNTDSDGTPASFVRKLAETIALHRLCSPPDTSVLVVSVIGPFESQTFQAMWRAHSRNARWKCEPCDSSFSR